jgi:hypothetical protein
MSTFTAQATTLALPPPDPLKHVNYVLGMVLGVDDFTQEFAYLSGHDQWLARDLLGYGTVSGLRVHVETGAEGPEVVVDPGEALSPRGQLIHVSPAQCAKLNAWLAIEENRREVLRRLGSPPSALRLAVVLCYRECPTDDVPIPGEPCRSEDELMAPSRLTDDFKLELRFEPPDQREEDAVRDFVEWLCRVEITDEAGSFATLEELLNAVRAATVGPASPPDFMYGSPPSSLRIHSADACDYLRAAFRLWVTELRPRWRPDWLAKSCCDQHADDSERRPDEDCLLLAEIDVPLVNELTGELKVDDVVAVHVDETRRPYLVHLRLLQEWLLCCRCPANGAIGSPPDGGLLAGDVTGPAASTTVEKLRHVEIDAAAPSAHQVLAFEGGKWTPTTLPPAAPGALTPSGTVAQEVAFGQPASGGTSNAYSRGDHTHGTPPDPIPPHRAAADAHPLGGDVTGNIGAVTVARIQNVPVVAGAPNEGDVLTVVSGQWQGAPAAAGVGDFVEHPKGLPRYAIVAAGWVRLDGTDQHPPVYNGLSAQAVASSTVRVRFNGYEQPDGSFQYLVKALPVIRDIHVAAPIVFFARFLSDALELAVHDGSSGIDTNTLAEAEMMIEISRYGRQA